MRRRILAAIVGVASVAVLIFAIPLAITVRNLTITDELSEIERAAERVGRGLEPESIPAAKARVHDVGGGEFATAVYDRSGRRVAGTGPAMLERDLRSALAGTVTSHSGAALRVAVPVGARPTTGVVRAAASSDKVDGRVVRAWLVLGAFGLLAVGAAAALGWWLSRRLDAPLVALAESAHRVGDGDFTTRSPRSGVPEIDGVAEAIDTTAGRLGAALERERAFSSNVSHQLRTRVAGLRVTLESAAYTGEEHDAISHAIEETDRLESTIVELLALARDAGSSPIPFDVGALLRELERTWAPRFAAAGRSLHVQSEPPVPQALASLVATRQILDVLIDNALRHGRGEVHMVGRAAHDGVIIDVEDDGPGLAVDPESLFRAESARGDGHGIGLALARSLAEADRGRLLVRQRSPGSVFRLVLPATTVERSTPTVSTTR